MEPEPGENKETTQVLRARHVLPIASPVIEDGCVVVRGGRIVESGRWHDLRARHAGSETDLGEVVLLPGLINAHCHLDYTMMRSAISPQRSFTEWIRRINALKRSLDVDDYRDAIQRGFAELKAWGTTTVANIESFPEILVGMRPPPVRTWWFLEMIDVRHREADDETMAGTLSIFDRVNAGLGGFGLSPHAPYTASGALYEVVSAAAARHGMPVTTHVAESREEWEMFRNGRGELHEFMLKLGRWMFDTHAGRTPFAHVAAHAQLGANWLLAHMNELDAADFDLLARMPRGQRPSVVHCPGSHRYFRHSPFPLARLRETGVNVCLGTDSLASTHSLSLFDEMRALADAHPWLHADDILEMATLSGARALGIPAGAIAEGLHADLIAIPHAGSTQEVQAAVLDHRKPVCWMMINGQIAI